jgi:hypothetical protein
VRSDVRLLHYRLLHTGGTVSDAESGTKPTGGGYPLVDWRLARIEKSLDDLAKNYVPLNIYGIDQQSIAKEFARAAQERADTRAALARFENDMNANRAVIEKNKKQLWIFVAGGSLVAVLSFLLPVIAKALGVHA